MSRLLTGPLGDLTRFGTAPALLCGGATLTYAELAERVARRGAELGPERRLVLLRCRNDVETVVSYLAALDGGHPVLLVGAEDSAAGLVDRYSPDVVADGSDVRHLTAAPGELHPDLALLLSTSGSTGSPKLVRLSADNVRSNAASIADYLGLGPDDRAVTSLPLHYCYGLSVLNSHLLVGASVVLTDVSVVDEEFWQLFRSAGATSFAGVPHTFELLEAAGFAEQELPTLRTVTQAGGRLAPDAVRRFARLGRRRGFDFVVMYGQTEATARMAWLPPHLAEERPECIGVPIPGGSFRVESVVDADHGVGELVYTGPNVMLGYAETRDDLALGRTVHELRTGDLARQHDDGLFEVVGRRSRFAKVFGLRLDLDRVEQQAARRGIAARAVEHDGRLHLFVTRPGDVATAQAVPETFGLPTHVVTVHVLTQLPRTPNGKPDHAALVRHARAARRTESPAEDEVTPERVRDLYATLLGRPEATVADSFVSLRGDSLSYVEASLRLGRLIPALPPDWAGRSAEELAAAAPVVRTRSRWMPIEPAALLRAVAIVLIVGTHANLFTVVGGAHVLLAVAGFNLARFQLSGRPRCERRRSLLQAAAGIAVPAALWIGGVTLLTGKYDLSTALLLNNLLGSDTWDVRWQFWFLEVIVWVLLGTALVLPLARVDRLERADPFRFAAGVVAGTLLLRYLLVGVQAGQPERYALPVVLWCVALGWLAARADNDDRRLLTSVVAVLACWGFFGDPQREALVAAGICLLVWVPRLRLPAALRPVLTTLAGSSLFVYLTHWQVYPHLEMDHPLLATLASFAVGVLVWRTWQYAAHAVLRQLPVLRHRVGGGDRLGGVVRGPVRRVPGRAAAVQGAHAADPARARADAARPA